MRDSQTGFKIADAYVAKLEKVKKILLTGVVVGEDDFIAAGITKSVVNDATRKLKHNFDVDILTVKRGHTLIGYILADEIL